jgi:electron transfer flavoprotein alpha subunit
VTVLVFVEHEDGAVAEASLETATLARRLAAATDGDLQAVAIGGDAPSGETGLGAIPLHVADDERLAGYAPAAWGRAVAGVAGRIGAAVVLAPGTDRGNEVAAHVAAFLGRPMAANCTDARPGDPLEVTRVRWGGSLVEEATLRGTPAVVTVSPHAVGVERAPGTAGVATFRPSLPDDDLRVRVTAKEQPPAGRVSLGEARVVVGGGRGMGGADGFEVLEELAGLLGGAVGCSRAVTSAGWRPHSDQIGQTGARIAPDLYIACGISGAIQHIVGCKAAKRIMTINTDPEAPILAQSDWAIVGDARAVVAALVAELRSSGY